MIVIAQRPTMELTFTADKNGTHVQMDNIKVMNRTQGSDTVLYWPDTTLTCEITPGDLLLYIGYAMDYPVGVQSISNRVAQFQLFQSYPNPVRDQSDMLLFLPSKGAVNMMVTDVRGSIIVNVDQELGEGIHSFRFSPGDKRIYFITTRWNGIKQSIKILTEGSTSGKTCKLEYIGVYYENASLKQSLLKTDLVVQESGILDTPDNDTTYTFQFATNIPCPGTATVEYEGQIYNTIQIFSQCWLKGNLNVGTRINGSQNQTNNSIIEKYCYGDMQDNCTNYGGLYQWNEMMQYTTQQGAQGICPPDWHLSTDEEWKVLEGAVDGQYGIGDPEWDLSWESRGYDAGTNLKATIGWVGNCNGTDLFGFSGLPGGYHQANGSFYDVLLIGVWWSSTKYDNNEIGAWDHVLDYYYSGVNRIDDYKENGFSVRCLRNY
jgi:uncharacterized protein (TIGR02145 family)